MNYEFSNYSCLSWYQFAIVVVLVCLILIVSRKFHLFSHVSWKKSIGFQMYVFCLSWIVIVSLILVKPALHVFVFGIVFVLFYKSITGYIRGLFRLFFSKVKVGDHIKVEEVEGILKSINFGGIHLMTSETKVFLPFPEWADSKIAIFKEGSKVYVLLECKDLKERTQNQSIEALKAVLFGYPFLLAEDITFDRKEDSVQVRARLASKNYQSGLYQHVRMAGFELI